MCLLYLTHLLLGENWTTFCTVYIDCSPHIIGTSEQSKESKLFIGKCVPLEVRNSQNFLSCNVTAQEEPMPWNIKLKSMHKVAAEGYSKCFHTKNFAN